MKNIKFDIILLVSNDIVIVHVPVPVNSLDDSNIHDLCVGYVWMSAKERERRFGPVWCEC